MKALSMVLSGIGGTLLAVKVSHDSMIKGMNTPLDVVPTCRVSIVMKNLNEEQRVRVAIESILNQSIVVRYPEFFEFIFVNGSSEDASVDIAKEYPINIFVTRPGVLHQKNVGIQQSKGDIIVFVDSDSEYPEYWVAKIIDVFNNDTNVVMVRTPLVSEEGGVFDIFTGFWGLAMNITASTYGGGTAVRSMLFDEIGLFNEEKDSIYLHEVANEEERRFPRRAMSFGKVVYLQNNPFITTSRRFRIPQILNECIINPQARDCVFARDVGYERF